MADETDLTIIEPDGKYWTANPISIDGIRNIEINGDVVSGMCYSLDGDKWQPFSYDIQNKVLIGGTCGLEKI